MSFETWRDEFLLQTDLEKWIGLRVENLRKHRLHLSESGMTIFSADEAKFSVTAVTCQLCATFYGKALDKDENSTDTRNGSENCSDCPLYEHLGYSCDFVTENKLGPYSTFVVDRSPEEMIQALTAIREQLPKRTENVNRPND